MKKPKLKPQRLAIYKHEERKLFYVQMINEDRYDKEAQTAKQYSRARSAHKAIIEGHAGSMSSGFMFAIINTDFTGWTVDHLEDIYETAEEANRGRNDMIELLSTSDWMNVGSHKNFVKGVYGTYATPFNWGAKLNVNGMKKEKIYEKIHFLFKAIEDDPDPKVVNAVYMGITCPDKFGPRAKNFGSYVIDSLANMFLFVRNIRGHDLP